MYNILYGHKYCKAFINKNVTEWSRWDLYDQTFAPLIGLILC